MNQSQKQIETYSKLVDPKPIEKKPEMETKKDLEKQLSPFSQVES